MSATNHKNRDGKKTQYKDYVNFLHNYKQGTAVSEDPVDMSVKSFKDYLENYNSKLYQPVQPAFIKTSEKKQVEKEEKMVKTEVFIQIDSQQNTAPRITKTFLVNTDTKRAEEPFKVFSKASAHVEHQTESNIYENTKNSLRKTPSLREKRRIFEENQEQPTRNNLALNKIKQKDDNAGNKTNVKELVRSKPLASSEEHHISGNMQPKAIQTLLAKTIVNIPTPQDKTNPACGNITQNKAIIDPNEPSSTEEQPVAENTQPEAIKSAAPTIAVIKPSPIASNSSGIPPPPPPPLPPSTPEKTITPKPAAFSKPIASPKLANTPSRGTVGYNTLPKAQGDRHKEVTDAGSKLDKSDPRMKKLVYGALREMYGNYHDKANDYLATLPKSRVKKNNGLDSIINSIASQGGLDKLSGRMNPKIETE